MIVKSAIWQLQTTLNFTKESNLLHWVTLMSVIIQVYWTKKEVKYHVMLHVIERFMPRSTMVIATCSAHVMTAA